MPTWHHWTTAGRRRAQCLIGVCGRVRDGHDLPRTSRIKKGCPTRDRGERSRKLAAAAAAGSKVAAMMGV